MTPQKQSELQKHRSILLASYDFLIATHGASIVFDNENFIAAQYEQEKLKVEENYSRNHLSKLKLQLKKLIEKRLSRADLGYTEYIKEKTGYDIDILEDVRKRVEAIIAQNEIRSKKERNDVSTMLFHYHKTSTEGEEVDKLKILIQDYVERTSNTGHTEIISSVVKDGIEEVTIQIFSNPKPKHYEVQEIVSPDGKRNLRLAQWSDGKHSSTYVEIAFPTASGPVYGVSGIHSNIKASWKNNSTIVIEAPKELVAILQHKQVRSYDDIITVEYL